MLSYGLRGLQTIHSPPATSIHLTGNYGDIIERKNYLIASKGVTMETQNQQFVAVTQNNTPSALVAYLLLFFVGILGIHHLYMGRGVGIWILSVITLQGFFVWMFVDLFLIPSSCSKVR